MTMIGKTLMGATAATALAVAAPAHASDNDGIDGGDILAGVLVLGGLAAVIAAASDDDDRYERDTRYDRRYDGPYARDYRGQYGGHARMRPRRAVNRCARAAVDRASRYGRAHVTEITEVDRRRDGYRVRGRLVVADGYRGGRRWNAGYGEVDRGRFSCRIRYGRIDRLRVRGLN